MTAGTFTKLIDAEDNKRMLNKTYSMTERSASE
jgi:hypothetical protein